MPKKPSETRHTAAIEYRCDRCSHMIEVGETYVKTVFKGKKVPGRKQLVMTYRKHERCQHSPTPNSAVVTERQTSFSFDTREALAA